MLAAYRRLAVWWPFHFKLFYRLKRREKQTRLSARGCGSFQKKKSLKGSRDSKSLKFRRIQIEAWANFPVEKAL